MKDREETSQTEKDMLGDELHDKWLLNRLLGYERCVKLEVLMFGLKVGLFKETFN